MCVHLETILRENVRFIESDQLFAVISDVINHQRTLKQIWHFTTEKFDLLI